MPPAPAGRLQSRPFDRFHYAWARARIYATPQVRTHTSHVRGSVLVPVTLSKHRRAGAPSERRSFIVWPGFRSISQRVLYLVCAAAALAPLQHCRGVAARALPSVRPSVYSNVLPAPGPPLITPGERGRAAGGLRRKGAAKIKRLAAYVTRRCVGD